MRIYNKISETEEKAIYEYLWGDYRSEYAGAYALYTLPKNIYPQRYTHTAP